MEEELFKKEFFLEVEQWVQIINLELSEKNRKEENIDSASKPDFPDKSKDSKKPEVKQSKPESIKEEDQTQESDNKYMYLSLEHVPKEDLKIMGAGRIEDRGKEYKFLLTDDYYPLSERQMEIEWRALRNIRLFEDSEDFDLDTTINRLLNDKVITQLYYKRKEIYTGDLILLFDHKGSMVGFHNLIELLLNSSKSARMNVYPFYFYNVPQDTLFHNPYHTEAISIEKFQRQFAQKNIPILIFSDAGSAKGKYNSIRVNKTISFIKMLKTISDKIVWLNPIEERRWEPTSAEYISNSIPMNEFSREGIYRAMQILQGKKP